MQLAEGGENDPGPLELQETIPVGDAPVTVAVHIEGEPTSTGDAQEMEVEVEVATAGLTCRGAAGEAGLSVSGIPTELEVMPGAVGAAFSPAVARPSLAKTAAQSTKIKVTTIPVELTLVDDLNFVFSTTPRRRQTIAVQAPRGARKMKELH